MKRISFTFRFGLVLLSSFFLAACAAPRNAQPVVSQDSTIPTARVLSSQTAQDSPTPTLSSAVVSETAPSRITYTPVKPTNTKVLPTTLLSPSLTPSYTPALTTASPLSSATSAASSYEVVLSLSGDMAGLVWNSSFFDVAEDGSIWIRHHGHILHFLAGELVQDIPFDVTPNALLHMETNDSGLWLLTASLLPDGIGNVIHLGFDGALIENYEIPKKFFVGADGKYDDVPISSLAWGGDGELLLDGENGLHQLLDASGSVKPIKLLAGYPSGGHIYRVENAPERSNSAVLVIDERRTVIMTKMEGILLDIVGFAPDGSFYISNYQYSGSMESYASIVEYFHYDAEGNLLEKAYKPDMDGPPAVIAFGQDHKMYMMVSLTDGSVQILRLSFTKVK